MEEHLLDTDMTGADATETAAAEGASAEVSAKLPLAEEPAEEARQTFISFLMSPVVSLLVGQSGDEKVLTVHQALLARSPYFKNA